MQNNQSLEEKENQELKDMLREQTMNNTMAVRVLFNIVAKNGLITEEEFNAAIRKESEKLKAEMTERIEKARREN